MAQSNPPLDEIRVLDLSMVCPGSYTTLLMADLATDVIKVEEPSWSQASVEP